MSALARLFDEARVLLAERVHGRRWLPGGCPLALFGVLALAPTRAYPCSPSVGEAEPSLPSQRDGLEVRWDAPATCPDRAHVERHIVAALADADDPDLNVVVVVSRRPGGFVARMVVETRVGRSARVLESPSCRTLLDAVATIAALAAYELDAANEAGSSDATSTAKSPHSAPQSRPTVVPARPQPPPASPPEPPTRPRSPPRGVRAGLFAGAGLSSGVVLGGSTHVQWGLVVRYRRLRIDGRGLRVGEQFVLQNGRPRAQLRAWGAALRGCGVFAWGPAVRVPLCGLVEAGAVFGRGFAVTTATAARRPFVAVGLEPQLTVDVTRTLSLYVAAAGIVTLVTPRFAILGSDVPIVARRWRGRFAFGVEARFR